jgi:hypothetical protein
MMARDDRVFHQQPPPPPPAPPSSPAPVKPVRNRVRLSGRPQVRRLLRHRRALLLLLLLLLLILLLVVFPPGGRRVVEARGLGEDIHVLVGRDEEERPFALSGGTLEVRAARLGHQRRLEVVPLDSS